MRVGLFVTCLVDMMRPSVGFAAIKLLEAGGAEIHRLMLALWRLDAVAHREISDKLAREEASHAWRALVEPSSRPM